MAKVHERELVGAAVGTSAGSVIQFRFLWSYLSFMPGTMDVSMIVGVVGAVIGLIGEEVLRLRYRGRLRRLRVVLYSGVVLVGAVIAYAGYVEWATMKGYESLSAQVPQHGLIFITVFLWSLIWSVAGASAWHGLFPADM